MENVRFQSPDLSHVKAITALVEGTRHLDTNSTYTYALWCTHFASQSAVAVRGNDVVAFLTAFRSPKKPESYFLWQTATMPRHGIPGLGIDLIEYAVKREIGRGARAIEASVDKDNKPIRLVMKTLCKRVGGRLSEELLYPSELLSSDAAGHHDETLMRIALHPEEHAVPPVPTPARPQFAEVGR